MKIRFISKRIHAFLDYPVAIALMALPTVLKLGESSPIAFWLGTVTGIAAFILTLLTNHHLGVLKVLPYSFHLLVDALVAVTFIVAPFVLGFVGIDAWFYWINGITVLAVVSLHKAEPELELQS